MVDLYKIIVWSRMAAEIMIGIEDGCCYLFVGGGGVQGLLVRTLA